MNMYTHHNLIKEPMLHCQCKTNGVGISITRCYICYMVINIAVLELQFAHVHVESHVRKYITIFSTAKVIKFWDGSVHTSILVICIINYFSNCCFGILMSMSFSCKSSIFQVNLGSQCQKTDCSGEKGVWYRNILHCHTKELFGHTVCTHLM